ncbi:MAG: hypothetical protein ACYC1P_05775 [Gaiellaceae bacterium]
MSELEPGLDLHEWQTRWTELDEALAEDPAGALVEACDLIEETLGLDQVDDGAEKAYEAARAVADAIERGEEVDPGDIGMAVENLRVVRASVRPDVTE